MVGRVMLFSLGAGLIAAHGPAPQSTKYKIETKVETTIDLSGVGQSSQQQTLNQTALITVGLSDTTGGRIMHVVVDSLAIQSDIQVPGTEEALAKAKGAWLHGFVDPRGKVTITKTSADSNDFVAELRGTMTMFLPRLKAGAKAGETWVDTTNIETRTSSRAIKATAITKYTVGGDDNLSGEKATRIDATYATTAAGTVQNPMAGAMEMESTESGTGKYFLSTDGRYLGGSSRSESKAKLKAAMLPDPIPIAIVRTSTISALK